MTGPDNTTARFSNDIAVTTPGELAFSNAVATIPNSGGSQIITVIRQGGSDGTVSVDYQTMGATAVAGTDFLPASGTLTFGPGDTQQSFTLTILNNPASISDRTLDVDLFNAVGGTIVVSPNNEMLTIQGNSALSQSHNSRYVSGLYEVILRRSADLGGANYWTGLINQGVSRVQVALSIEYSLEGRIAQVETLYATYLHCAADPLGLASSVGFLNTGGTVEQLKAVILGSQEYFASKGGGEVGFLNGVFEDVLGRGIETGAVMLFERSLAKGASRYLVAQEILESPEAERVLVQSLYLLYLNRPADPLGAETFLTALQNGARDEAVLAAILGSDEFFSRV